MSQSIFLKICLAVLMPGIALATPEGHQPTPNRPAAPLTNATEDPPSSPAGLPVYAMVRATTGSGALRMTSASYTTTATLGQRSPTGGASFCNSGGRTTAGFWSLLGHVHVPIVLAGKRNTADPTGSVDLQWSGTASSFRLYRDLTDAIDVDNPANLDQEPTVCSTVDPFAFQSDLIFYLVTEGAQP